MKLLWSDVQGTSIGALEGQLRSKAKLFRQVTIEDLADKTSKESVGLYFFFDGDQLMYMGKSSSRAFIERIPSHLDVRPGNWFGTLLHKLANCNEPPCRSADCLARALDVRLTLLVANAEDMPEDELKDLLESTEYGFRVVLKSKLNPPKNPRMTDPNTPLGHIE